MEVRPKFSLQNFIQDYSDMCVAASVGLYFWLVTAEKVDVSHWYCLYLLQVPLCYFYILNKRTFAVANWEAFVKSTCFTREFDLLKKNDPQIYYTEMIKLLMMKLKCRLHVEHTPEEVTVRIKNWHPSNLTMYLWIVCNPLHLLVASISGSCLYQMAVSLFFAIQHTLMAERIACQQALAELRLNQNTGLPTQSSGQKDRSMRETQSSSYAF